MSPINITTAEPMVMFNHLQTLQDVDYFTYTTELHYPHWDKPTTAGVYYPTRRLSALDESGRPKATVIRDVPDWYVATRSISMAGLTTLAVTHAI